MSEILTGIETDLAMMTEEKWQAVAALTKAMRQGRVSANELKKVVTYVRWWRNRHDGAIGEHLFEYLQVLIREGDTYSQVGGWLP